LLSFLNKENIMEKFVSISRADALQLLDDKEYTTEVRKRGRHFFVKTDAPLPTFRRLFFNSRGQLVDNGPEAEFRLSLDYIGQTLVSVEAEFVE
jgi:hypothetical protein